MEAYLHQISQEKLDQHAKKEGGNVLLAKAAAVTSDVVELRKQGYKELDLPNCKHIVVGSGMGGGMVARQLTENGENVVLLEKGGVLHSTHYLNTSRPHFNPKDRAGPGRDNELIFQDKDKHGNDRRIIRIPYDSDEKCSGGSVFALGGRSLLWSLEAPRIRKEAAEKHFPKDVIDDLYGVPGTLDDFENTKVDTEAYYENALRILANVPPGNGAYPKNIAISQDVASEEERKFKEAAEATNVQLVSVGAEFTNGKDLYYFPQSAYSTVDYLLDRGVDSRSPLVVRPNHSVTELVKGHEKIAFLLLTDERGKKRYVNVKEKNVVLCAGTVNTAAIALRSGLQEDNNLVGQGLTDHEIWMAKYWKGPTGESPVEVAGFVNVEGHDALLTVCRRAEKFFRRDFADGSGEPRAEGTNCLNIMVEFEAPLNNQGRVELTESKDPKLTIQRKTLGKKDELKQALTKRMHKIRTDYDFLESTDQPEITDEPTRQDFGSVAHEVGTMRMEKPEENIEGVVDKNLQVKGFGNLYVCDLSVFPFSPAANPSLTLTALAMRLGEYLTGKP